MMRRLLMMALNWLVSRAFSTLGVEIPANRPMIATTIMISRSVNAAMRLFINCYKRVHLLPSANQRTELVEQIWYHPYRICGSISALYQNAAVVSWFRQTTAPQRGFPGF